jgi:CHAT domain-containing protein/Tfp pilus assembly protein PilF
MLVLFAAIPLPGQTSTEPAQGVKVLKVEPGSEAAKAGILSGDLILAWSQGGRGGSIASPFDFKVIERERSPRAAVTLSGVRLGKRLSWMLKTERWGIEPGAAWPGVQLVLDRLSDLAKANKLGELAEYCRAACMSLNAPSGARSYALSQAGVLLARAAHINEAGEFFNRALNEKPKGLNYFAARIYGAWADGYLRLNDWASTSSYYEKALRETKALRSCQLNAAFYLYKLSTIKYESGALREASKYARDALSIRRSVAPQSVQTEMTLNALGVYALQAGDLEAGNAWLQQALVLARQIDPRGAEVETVYANLAVVSLHRGDLATAEKYIVRCLDMSARLNPDDYRRAYYWGNLGTIAYGRRNFVRAEQCHERALALLEKGVQEKQTFAEIEMAMTLNNLAGAKAERGDRADAAILLKRALAIQEHSVPKSLHLAQTLSSYGNLLQKQGDSKIATETYFRALAILEAINPGSLETAGCRYYLAELHAQQGDLAEAESDYHRSAELQRILAPKSVDYAESLVGLAAVEERLHKTAAAIRDYSKAIAILDSQSSIWGRADSIHFGSAYAEYYTRFAALLLAQGQTRRAFEISDRARARTLVRTLSEDHINIRAGIPVSLLEKDRKLEASLAELSESRIKILTGHQNAKSIAEIDHRIADTTADHELAEERMRVANPQYAALTQPKPTNLIQLQQLLEPDTVVLEYSLGKEQSYLFAVDRQRLSSFRLPPRAELDKLARGTYGYWSKSIQQVEGENAYPQRLSELTIGPAADFIKGHHRLLIVADGGLQYVPFAALPMPRRSSAFGQPLASQFEVVNLPSASLLVMLRQHPAPRTHSPRSIAVIGDPVFAKDDPRVAGGTMPRETQIAAIRSADSSADLKDDDSLLADDDISTRGLQLSRLIHSREEAEAIGSVSPKDRLLMALDFDANRTTALDPKVTHSRIVHFATHGLFDSKNPAMSGLVLSLVDKQGKPQAGFLGLDDIYRSRFSADLVVASACETALGEEINGEGLVGLTWGFIYAGARSVVASLWRVNDASTAELMRLFYTGMELRGLTPAAALREAQLAIARTPGWSSPYFWAGFVIEGEYAAAPRIKPAA